MQPTSIQAQRQLRRERLALLLEEYGQRLIAEKTGISAAYLYQMSKAVGTAARSVSDANARQIEARIGLPPGWLDSKASLPAKSPGGDEPIEALHHPLGQSAVAAPSEPAPRSQSVSDQRAMIAAVVRLTDYVRDVALEPIPPEKQQAVIDAAIRVVEAVGVERITDGTSLADAARQVAAELRAAR